jgi:hypothetical protein
MSISKTQFQKPVILSEANDAFVSGVVQGPAFVVAFVSSLFLPLPAPLFVIPHPERRRMGQESAVALLLPLDSPRLQPWAISTRNRRGL